MANTLPPRGFAFVRLALLFTLPGICLAQDSYTVTWTIQNPSKDLQHDFAEYVIERINNWMTRDDVEAQTARLDDPLHITLLGTYNPDRATVTEKIVGIKAGYLTIEDDPTLFLETRIIDSLIRRNYQWTDLDVEVFDSTFSPEYYRVSAGDVVAPVSQFDHDRWLSSRTIISFIESRAPIGHQWRVGTRIGMMALGMPGLSFGQAAIGIGNDHAVVWGMIPLPALSIEGLGGPQTGAFGGAASFDLTRIGGSITLIDPASTLKPIDTARPMLFGSIRLFTPWVAAGTLLGGQLRCEFGGILYSHGVIAANMNGGFTTSAELVPRLSIMTMLSMPSPSGSLRRRITIGTTGTSFMAGWWEQFTDKIGIELEGSLNGLIEDPLPFLPRYAVWLTPVIIL